MSNDIIVIDTESQYNSLCQLYDEGHLEYLCSENVINDGLSLWDLRDIIADLAAMELYRKRNIKKEILK